MIFSYDHRPLDISPSNHQRLVDRSWFRKFLGMDVLSSDTNAKVYHLAHLDGQLKVFTANNLYEFLLCVRKCEQASDANCLSCLTVTKPHLRVPMKSDYFFTSNWFLGLLGLSSFKVYHNYRKTEDYLTFHHGSCTCFVNFRCGGRKSTIIVVGKRRSVSNTGLRSC